MISMFLCVTAVYATHNRAGEIRVEQIGELTVRATVITYTKASSVDADRDSLTIDWGDGVLERVVRSNGGGNGVEIGNNIKINEYVSEHTFPGFSTYIISMLDPNRNSGILNVNPPNSINVPFYLETTISVFSSQFQGFNRTAILTQAPLDFGCTEQIFEHNPGAFDPDGDSLAYELIPPKQGNGLDVPNYSFPDQIVQMNNTIFFDEEKGDFVWMFPQLAGEYNIAILIKEFRNGNLIAKTVRDMQILIDDCDNHPPEVQTTEEICLIAGETLELDVFANDVDEGQQVKLEAEGGVFIVENSAVFFVDQGYQDPILQGTLVWETNCNNIREQPYEVIFKATDNFAGETGLSDLKRVSITVIGPPPLDLTAQPEEELIRIEWEDPYACEDAENDYFRGFSVWRKPQSTLIDEDCSPGLDGKGYERIAFGVSTSEDGRYFFNDLEVERAHNYCYRVLADFALNTEAGNLYNLVSSLPSNEDCALFQWDIPILKNASVLKTDAQEGIVLTKWVYPNPDVLDTIENPAEYRVELWRADGITEDISLFQPVPGAEFIANSFQELISKDSFVDMNLNTQDQANSYSLFFYVDGQAMEFGISPVASTPFLQIASTDRRNILSLEYLVPWTNYAFKIFREDESGEYILWDQTDQVIYDDFPLENDVEYCYYVETEGSYFIPEIPDVLLNNSQINCGTPIDTLAPCPPIITANNVCDEESPDPDLFFSNFVNWEYIISADCLYDDLARVQIYYATTKDAEFELVAELTNPVQTSFEHQLENSIAGCYAIRLVDFTGNISDFSNVVCVDNCPDYSLPNVFTPNSDGANDLFQPFPYRFIERIDLKIFNRWGQLVHETKDPDINWDGTNLKGKELAEGVYFYQAQIFEKRVDGIQEAGTELSGFIHLLR